MFKNETVFILGAGASWHYGYPTGEDLVKKIISETERMKSFFKKIKNSVNQQDVPLYLSKECNDGDWNKAIEDCEKLIKTLIAVDPLVIDYFLSQNEDLQPIGKLMIAWVILQCETKFLNNLINENKFENENRRELLKNSPDTSVQFNAHKIDLTKYNDNWYKFISHQLLSGIEKSEELLSNKVSFVTFNYDVSLEYQLYRGLSNTQMVNENHVEKFLVNNRIIHMYGAVRDFSGGISKSIFLDSLKERSEIFFRFNSPEKCQDSYGHNVFKNLSDYIKLLNEVYTSSKEIRTIDGANGDKEIEDAITAAKNKIKKAKVVYILGYGFDENNSDRLGLKEALNPLRGKHVMFTNFGNRERINKKAGIAFCNDPNLFSGDKNIQQRLNPSGKPSYYYERSIKNVYDAFADDFDALETYDL